MGPESRPKSEDEETEEEDDVPVRSPLASQQRSRTCHSPQKLQYSDRRLQAITALKKGAQLLKYGRKGPEFCPFRLSNDETTLIWYSGKEEKCLPLNSVMKIVSGQRTANFQSNPRPEKESQSLSLIYGKEGQSLDLICKDKDEAEVWFSGLTALVSNQQCRTSFDIKSSGAAYFLSSKIYLDGSSLTTRCSVGSDTSIECSTGVDALRMSMDSTLSSGTQGSVLEEEEALGDVFMWGSGIAEGALGGGTCTDNYATGVKVDALLPKALHITVLDVANIACGNRHAALVTKQGELYSWGEECGGRLGHGVDANVPHPQLVEALANTRIRSVACGEYHTCAISISGDLYTWGGGAHNLGLLGHGNDVGHWMPKQVGNSLEGISISFVACGPWHTAVISTTGQLFTFGDGTFGVLGHGDKASCYSPREVEALKGLKTVSVACGVWHTAAIVEEISGEITSGKLFTWGDGDKGKLGHGDKEQRFVPTHVENLMNYTFCQVACGHSITVALTNSGRVFTMGSPAHGQLGVPQANGKHPCPVYGSLADSSVLAIACGEFHVAVLTEKGEVYTWGKGENGRLGHGDLEDRSLPTLVEALKDKQIKSIACGHNFTAVICSHKWVSGTDRLFCSGCKQAFGFTRKRHNCYNCGLAYCHGCSAKKALKAALAPSTSKPYRVCDPCFSKLTNTNMNTFQVLSKKGNSRLRGSEVKEKHDKPNSKILKFELPTTKTSALDLNKKVNVKDLDNSTKWTDVEINIPSKYNNGHLSKTPSYSKRYSPPRSKTPIPTRAGLVSPEEVVVEMKEKNEALKKEVEKLKAQVNSMVRKCQLQENKLQQGAQQITEALALASEESSKCVAAKEAIKSLTMQLKDFAGRVPGATNEHGRSVPKMLYAENIGNLWALENLIPQTKDVQMRYLETRNLEDVENVHLEEEWTEHEQPGITITLNKFPDGQRILKRIKFSRDWFTDKEAEAWWQENSKRIREKYDVKGPEKKAATPFRDLNKKDG